MAILAAFILVLSVPGTVGAAAAEAACVACKVDVAAARQRYATDQWTALGRGEVVSFSTLVGGSGGGGGSSHQDIGTAAIIRHPPAEVWSVLSDFVGRAKFMPSIKEVRVVRTEGDRVWVAELLKIMWMKIRYNFVSTLDAPNGRISWDLDKTVENDIAESTGSWQMVPLDDGRCTLVEYRSRIDSGRPLPEFVESFLTRRSLPEIVQNVRAEVERRNPELQQAPPGAS